MLPCALLVLFCYALFAPSLLSSRRPCFFSRKKATVPNPKLKLYIIYVRYDSKSGRWCSTEYTLDNSLPAYLPISLLMDLTARRSKEEIRSFKAIRVRLVWNLNLKQLDRAYTLSVSRRGMMVFQPYYLVKRGPGPTKFNSIVSVLSLLSQTIRGTRLMMKKPVKVRQDQ